MEDNKKEEISISSRAERDLAALRSRVSRVPFAFEVLIEDRGRVSFPESAAGLRDLIINHADGR